MKRPDRFARMVMKAWEAGYDSIMRGPTIQNCHFSLFATPEQAAAWEQGVRDAKHQQELLEGKP